MSTTNDNPTVYPWELVLTIDLPRPIGGEYSVSGENGCWSYHSCDAVIHVSESADQWEAEIEPADALVTIYRGPKVPTVTNWRATLTKICGATFMPEAITLSVPPTA